MTYHLHIYHAADEQGGKHLDLRASVAFEPGKAPRVVDAAIDHIEGLALTEHGQNAFRCLCLGEEMIAHALHIPTIQSADKQALAELEAEVQRLRARVADLEVMEEQLARFEHLG